MLRGGVRAARDGACNRDDIDDTRALSEPRQERERRPDGPEVIDADHALDHLALDAQIVPARGTARVVHEQVDPWVPLEHARRNYLDGHAVSHIALLVLVG